KPFTFSNISTVTGAILAPSTTSFQDNSAGFGGAGGAGGIDTQTGTIDHRICAYNARGIQCAYGVPAKPPAPPSSPAAAKSGTTANVSWTASASTDVKNYLVFRWSGTAWAQIASVGNSTLTYADTGLATGRHYYHVCASNARGKRCNQTVAFVDI
ncbi:MAG: hypothetical protein JO247_15305, partial [Chloroflexi bacterium]|nr:hypothetical protein [Chloroflexota bacterium]